MNDKPHIGHAYTSLATDVLARWKRLDGHEVFFLTGTDEHGQKVEKAAQDAGMDPQAFTDQVSQSFRALAERMGFSNDDFIRTTEPRHKRGLHRRCGRRWRSAARSTSAHYEGWYAVRDEAFYGAGRARPSATGAKYAPTGAPVEWVKEPSYFFRLSNWQDRLLEFYEAQPGLHRARLAAQRGDQLRASPACRTSRSPAPASRWGMPVPGDAEHVMYVWLDALTNYITAVGLSRMRRGRAGGSGRPTSISSARTSCASTRSTGRPS